MKHLLKQAAAVAALGSVLFVLQLFAFTENNSVPPGDNVPAPLNVGSSGQSKTGGLILNTGGAPNGLIVQNGKVGVDVTNPATLFEVAQNAAIKIGKAYLSSGSSGEYAHLASNEWFDGSVWHVTGAGALLQFAGQNIAFYKHEATGDNTSPGSHTVLANISPSGDLDASGHVKGGSLCIGSDCRTSWPSTSAGASNFGGLYQTDDRNGGCVRGNPLNGGSCSCPAGFTNYQAASFILGRYGNSVELFNGTLWQCIKP